MICKIKHGQNFQGCLDYITGKYDKAKQAKVIMHSEGIPLLENKTVAQVFEAYATKGNNNIREPVGHYAYSFHKKDGSRVTDDLMRKVVREHMELMGIKDTEFIMTRHYDTDHDHAHLMCSMVDRDGHVISTAYEKERNARICKYLTKKYYIIKPVLKQDRKYAPSFTRWTPSSSKMASTRCARGYMARNDELPHSKTRLANHQSGF